MKGLTNEQQVLFDKMNGLRQAVAVNFISGGYENGKAAYLKACKDLKRKPSKNPETSSCEILRYPNVRDFIASIQAEAAADVRIDAAWVLNNAKRVFDRCMQDEAVIVAGEPTGQYKFDSTGANKALDTIGKHVDVQAYAERVITTEMTHEQWLDSLK